MTEPPEELTEPPNFRPAASKGNAVDPLSDVLAAVRLSGGVFLEASFTAPWCVMSQVTAEECQPLGGVPAHIIGYHYVVSGAMVVDIAGAAPLTVSAGEIVLIPRNESHMLASAPGLKPAAIDHLVQPPEESGLFRLRYGGGGQPTQIICGFLGCEAPENPLVATLPALMKTAARPGLAATWVENTLRLLGEEAAASRAGSATVLARLADLLFVEAVRGYLATLPEGETGWLAGLKDPVVGRSLALLHAKVADPWTTETLAREVGLSRSAFADRFTGLLGMPPMGYLGQWRMQLAGSRLRTGNRSIEQIAFDVGYESDAAFIRAFKRSYGVTPSAWRRRERAEE